MATNNNYFRILNTITLNSKEIKNIFSRYDIFNDTNNYIEYKIRDGDDLISLATKFYGNKKYWWIIALYNNIHDPFYDLPLSEQELRDYVIKYLDEEGDSGDDYNTLYQEFSTENESKRTIFILKKYLLNDILTQFKNEIDKIS